MIWFFVAKLAALFFAAKDSSSVRWRAGLAAVAAVLLVNLVALVVLVTAAEGWIVGASRSWPFALATAAICLTACRYGFRAAEMERVDLMRSRTLERAALGFLGVGLLDLATGLVIAGAVALAAQEP